MGTGFRALTEGDANVTSGGRPEKIAGELGERLGDKLLGCEVRSPRRIYAEVAPKDFPETVILYDEDGNTTGEVVGVDMASLSTSKMVYAKASVKDGTLVANPVAMGQLFNPNVGPTDVLRTLRGAVVSGSSPNSLSLFIEGGLLMVRRGSSTPEVLAEFTTESSPLVLDGIRLLRMRCGIR